MDLVSCPVSIITSNHTPVVNAGADYIIPKGTAFILTGTASDADATDVLKYNWEQGDESTSVATAGTGCTTTDTKVVGPTFRVYNADISPVRYMPKMAYVLAGQLTNPANWESVSNVERDLNFNFIARDYHPGQGQTNSDMMLVHVNVTSGPFTVTSQNTNGISWTAGTTQTVTWAVNNTNTLAGSANVNVLLSTDGGLTFPTVLGNNIPNNGSLSITAPNTPSATCRIMVKPTANIYFAVNSSEFAIAPSTAITSTIQGTQCGSTLSTIDQEIFANIVSGAQGYRFKVTKMISGVPSTNPADIQTIDRVLRVFRITQLTSYAFDTTYQVEVAIRKFNIWQTIYGSPCSVTTPATTTTVQSSQCGSTLTTMNDVIYANNVPFATGYRFRIINVTSGGAPVILDRTLRDVRLSLLASPLFNTTYSIEVAVRNTDGTYLSFGPLCNVTSPSFPTTSLQTSQCDYVAMSNTEIFYADLNTVATKYRFRFMLGTTIISTIDKNLRTFKLNEISGLTAGTSYTVQVALQIGGVFGPYGKACTLTTPGGGARQLATTAVVDFKAVAYPNPFADNFKLDVKTVSDEAVQIRVYDMFGKLLENRQIEISDFINQEVGANYRSGVYNVVVNQGTASQTLRVIKR
jgi:Secretion system C-terminal sorting domain/PKD domain